MDNEIWPYLVTGSKISQGTRLVLELLLLEERNPVSVCGGLADIWWVRVWACVFVCVCSTDKYAIILSPLVFWDSTHQIAPTTTLLFNHYFYDCSYM